MDWHSLESRPGSFSKNFGWQQSPGMARLHQSLNLIFSPALEPVRRDHAAAVISKNLSGDPLVVLNFFVFNTIHGAESFVVPDELVIQALGRPHNRDFDILAVLALAFSRVGVWRGAQTFQKFPAPWFRNFLVDELADNGTFRRDRISADNIESYLEKHLDYSGDSPRKFATNLNFILRHSGFRNLSNGEQENWWVPAIRLFIDRLLLTAELSPTSSKSQILEVLEEEKFYDLTAVKGSVGKLAATSAIEEYIALGALTRLSLGPPDSLARGGSASEEQYRAASRRVRDQTLVATLKTLYRNECALCGHALAIDSEGNTYSEVGHVKPIGKPFKGPDNMTNALVFCPNHHKQFDKGGAWIEVKGKELYARSVVGEGFDGRLIIVHDSHPFDAAYADWHATYFGHK